MVQLVLRPELEKAVRDRLADGVDANDLMEAALEAMVERDEIREAIDLGWRQAAAGEFVDSSPESVLRRADETK